MKFSLITGTLGRTEELLRLLESLAAQTEKDFEFFIVDQNTELDLAPLIQPYQSILTIHHIKTSQRGLSRARNLVLPQAQGEIIAFPDDDCWYPEDLLERIWSWFEEHPEWDGLFAASVGAPGETRPVVRFPMSRFVHFLSRSQSPHLFLRRRAVEQIGSFDETIGPSSGSAIIAREDADYVLRGWRRGLCFFHDSSFLLCHDAGSWQALRKDPVIARGYGLASGMVVRRHVPRGWGWWYGVVRKLLALGYLWLQRGRSGDFKGANLGVRWSLWCIEGYLRDEQFLNWKYTQRFVKREGAH